VAVVEDLEIFEDSRIQRTRKEKSRHCEASL
jgi:hypothetical protein